MLSLRFSFDKDELRMKVFKKEFLVEDLSYEEFLSVEKEMVKEKEKMEIYQKLSTNDYAQIIMEDVDYFEPRYDCEKQMLKKVIGIELEVDWMTRLNHTEGRVFLLFEDGTNVSVNYPDNIDRNFSDEQVKFGKASIEQIRNCLDEEVLEYIKKHLNFVVKFCNYEIPRDVLFGEDEMYFDFGTCSDT